MMENLIHYLGRIHPMSAGLEQHLRGILKEKTLSKKEYLLKTGETCGFIYFIEQGLLRCFYEKEKKQICSWFMKEGDMIASIESFYDQQPSYESIQALENCRLYYISYDELQYLYKHFPEFNTTGRLLTEHYYLLWAQQLYSLRMHRAAERYEWLVANFPDLFQRVSARQLSTWIGITEVTLSNLRCRK